MTWSSSAPSRSSSSTTSPSAGSTAALAEIMKGIVKGCRQAGCALVGGETAELPGLYAAGKWDLAGFCVGLVDAPKIIDGRTCRPGDKVIGLASSGLHSNGFSLARKAFYREGAQGKVRPRAPPADEDLHPAHPRGPEKNPHQVHGPHHRGRLLRQYPARHPGGAPGRRRRKGSWPIPPIFKTIREKAGIGDREMFRTFNMGVGMALVTAAADADRTIALFAKLGLKAWAIGDIERGEREVILK